MRRVVKINAVMQANIIKLMLEGTYSCAELAEMTGAHYVTVLQYTRELHRAKAAHIAHWDKDSRGRDIIKVYKIGEGRDAKRQKLTHVERSARYRTKQRQANELAVVQGRMTAVQTANGRLRFVPEAA